MGSQTVGHNRATNTCAVTADAPVLFPMSDCQPLGRRLDIFHLYALLRMKLKVAQLSPYRLLYICPPDRMGQPPSKVQDTETCQ